MLAAVALGALGLVLLETAFASNPDPRLVLAHIFGTAAPEQVSGVAPEFQYQGTTDLPFTQIVDSRRQASVSGQSISGGGGGGTQVAQ